jgi:hypothetical protein
MHQPNEHDIYSLIGFTLTYIQSVERNIKFCTTFVLQGDTELTWERLQHIDGLERKKALGYFLGKVKERAQLFPAFEELLNEFLQKRNDFVHNQDKIAGWNLSTAEGVLVARKFVVSLLRQAHIVNEIFAALVTKWQVQAKLDAPTTPELQAYLEEIENRYGAYIDTFFTAKET